MSELWRVQKTMRRILGRPGLRIVAESELGVSLEQSGAWAVHTPGLVVVADEIAGEPWVLNSAVCHESGHESLSPASVAAEDLRGLQSVLSSPWRSWPLHRGEQPWKGHDSRWIRAVCHVGHRMRGHGLVTVPAAVANLSLYGLKSSLSEYVDALGDEPSRLDWLPLGEALARPAPAEFESLWIADCQRSGFVGSSAERKSDVDVTGGTSTKSGAGRRRRRT